MYRFLYRISRKFIPKVSETEKIALSVGDTSIDKNLLSGNIQLGDIRAKYIPKKPNIQKAVQLVKEINRYDIEKRGFINKNEIEKIKNSGLLGMIIPKKYGGLEYSYTDHSAIVSYLGSYSSPLAVTVMVPNSLGPAELLLHYGTERQKDYFLPRLSSGDMIPCFGLTTAWSGSDAANMPCRGIIEKLGEEIVIRLNIDKRYITLAPIADCIGVAFYLDDPHKLMGGKNGITLALLERKKYPNIDTSQCHDVGVGFYNGKVVAKDMIIKMEDVIGEESGVGNGWRMLMECLSAGRGISLPAGAIGSSKFILNYTLNYSQWREQFKSPLYKMEGVKIKLANMILDTITATSGQGLFNTILDTGSRPPVLSGIMKYRTTEYGRNVLINAMDVLAGVAICRGPNNPISESWRALPISINVEGNNVLTRNLIIFGNGLLKSHPHIYPIVEATNVVEFKKHFNGLVKIFLQNYVKSYIIRRDPFQRQLSQFVVYSHLMLLLGKRFKSSEYLSGRLADILSNLYFYTSLDWYESQTKDLEYLTKMAKKRILYENSELLKDLHRNLPIFWVKPFLSSIKYVPNILDNEISKIVEQGINNSDLLSENVSLDHNEYLGLMRKHSELLEKSGEESKRIRDKIIQVDTTSFSNCL